MGPRICVNHNYKKRKPIKYQKSSQDGPLTARQSPPSDVLNRDRSVITSTSWHQQSWVKPHMYSHSAFICSSANDLFCVCVLHIFDAVLFKICHRQTPAKVLKTTFCGCSHYKTSSWHTHTHTHIYSQAGNNTSHVAMAANYSGLSVDRKQP